MPRPKTPTPGSDSLRPWTWPWLLATTLAKGVLACVVCLGLWGAVPAVVGWLPTTVSSGSMLPRLHVGDVAVSRPLGTGVPRIGQVLLFDDPDHPGRLRMHRFVALADDGRLITRGDANPQADSTPLDLGAVRGIGTLRVPYAALPVVWVREGSWWWLALALSVLGGLGGLAAQARRFGHQDHERPGGRGGPTSGSRGGGGKVRRRMAGLLAMALGLVPATPAGSAFADTTASSASATAAPYFTCAGAVAARTPYLWWRLDETTGTRAADSSGNNRFGTLVGSVSGVTTKACARDTGGALTFNGTNGYLYSTAAGTAPTTFSLALWFRTTTVRGGKLIGFGNAQTGASTQFDRHLYMTNAGALVLGVNSGGIKTVVSPATYNDGAWHHAVATLSSTGLRLYVDGDQVAANTAVTSALNISGYWRVAYDSLSGWPSAPTSAYFAGSLDDVSVHLTALTPAQVDAARESGT